MASTNFGFPHSSPYSVQIELMTDVYNAIENRNIAFFESPTGTGKTLTLLCGGLSWLASHAEKPNDIDSISELVDEPEWLKKARALPRVDLNVSTRNFSAKKRKAYEFDSVPILDNKIKNMLSFLYPTENADTYNKVHSGNGLIAPKIFYCSRTHSQLSQVVRELRKTSFFSKDSVLNLATTTGSRNSLCINKKVIECNKSSIAINEACNNLISTEEGCAYYNLKKKDSFDSHLQRLSARRVLDIEDIAKSGSESHCCPYFSSRHLVDLASFVATPYNVILDKSTRETYNIDLANNIVIFDEAHNIIDFIKQMNSVTISSPSLAFKRIVDCISTYISKYGKRLGGLNASSISQLLIFFRKVSEFKFTSNIESYTINSFIYEAKIDSFNFSRLATHIENSKLFSKVFDETLSHLIPHIKSFIHALEVADHDGLFLVSADELKYICTNVIKVMRDVLEPCRAVIFCGGTMSPISETILQLIPEDFQSRTLSKAVDHIISPSNVNISLLATGPSGAKFNFSFETRFDCKMIKDLGITLLNYSKIIPAGVVVFFASFSYMEYVLDTWLYQNVMANLSDIKEVFIEKKSAQSETLLAEFEATIRGSKNGAILFAVMGGKLSEGINFSDDLGRGVITIGLPYPNCNELEVQEQMKAYVALMQKVHSTKSKQQLEKEYLESACMRTINQTIGRAFRHKYDYATIVMIDERSIRNSVLDRLPTWISSSITDKRGEFSYSFRSISQFFQKKLNSPGKL